MKAVILRHREWDKIYAQVKQDYADTPATYLIRTRMVKDLGWTWREHIDRHQYDEGLGYDPSVDYRDYMSRIHIDFYTEEARTYFLLRYMNRAED